MSRSSPTPVPYFADHARGFESFRFVYPVVSRRSGGISLGVNLNPDKVCNFDCIYCQVDRTRAPQERFVDLPRLLQELEQGLELVLGGRLFEHPRFAQVPQQLRTLQDMAFSGDGEPTTYSNFDQIIQQCVEVKRRAGVPQLKMVLITNATMFHRPVVQRGLRLLDENQGEIWAKLEWGTEAYYRLVTQSSIPMNRVLQNITEAARERPLVIQSLFMRIHGQEPPEEEIAGYCGHLERILQGGGQIARVQVYTVARPPAQRFVEPLSLETLAQIAQQVHRRCGLAVQWFGPHGAEGQLG